MQHLEGWSDLLTASNPPISSTVPISPNTVSLAVRSISRRADLPFLSQPADLLQPYPISFSNALLKSLIPEWQPKHRLDAATVRDTVAKFKEEGNWPNAAPK